MGKSGNSLRSPWISISKVWKSVESLALTKLGNGSRTSFWSDIWVGTSPLKGLFSLLYRIVLLPQGSVANHWDFATLSWSLPFTSLKDAEIVEFESLLSLLPDEQVLDFEDHKVWSIDPMAGLQLNLSRPICIQFAQWIIVYLKPYGSPPAPGELIF